MKKELCTTCKVNQPITLKFALICFTNMSQNKNNKVSTLHIAKPICIMCFFKIINDKIISKSLGMDKDKIIEEIQKDFKNRDSGKVILNDGIFWTTN